MNDAQKLRLTDHIAEVFPQAIGSPNEAVFILMRAALSICRTYERPDDLTKLMFTDLVDRTGDGADNDAPVRLVN